MVEIPMPMNGVQLRLSKARIEEGKKMNIGIPKDKTLRRYNLVDLDTGNPIACSHPMPDSALCDACYGRLIKASRKIELI